MNNKNRIANRSNCLFLKFDRIDENRRMNAGNPIIAYFGTKIGMKKEIDTGTTTEQNNQICRRRVVLSHSKFLKDKCPWDKNEQITINEKKMILNSGWG